MPKYIVLANYTDQGIRNIRESPDRGQTSGIVEMWRTLGITAERYYTMGPYDNVMVLDAPNDEAVTQSMLFMGSHGNLRTMTMRAFTGEEGRQIIGGLPPA